MAIGSGMTFNEIMDRRPREMDEKKIGEWAGFLISEYHQLRTGLLLRKKENAGVSDPEAEADMGRFEKFFASIGGKYVSIFDRDLDATIKGWALSEIERSELDDIIAKPE